MALEIYKKIWKKDLQRVTIFFFQNLVREINYIKQGKIVSNYYIDSKIIWEELKALRLILT